MKTYPPVPAALLQTSGLPPFLLLFAGLYFAYGTESAYLPAFLSSHGLSPQTLGFILAAGTIVRICAGPLAGHLADRLGARGVLAVAFVAAGFIGTGYLAAYGTLALLAVGIAHAVATAPLAPLADALALAGASGGKHFQYGWVRGAGSAAFVGGTLLSGQMVDRFGLSWIVVASSAAFAATAFSALRVKAAVPKQEAPRAPLAPAVRSLWTNVRYRRVLLVAALVIGSHAMNDAFAVIVWQHAGLGNETISLLWSTAVASEIVVFVLVGPWLQSRFGAPATAAIAASAGILRWTMVGVTTSVPALIVLQTSHGLTFALMHMTATNVIVRNVPERIGATAQAIYGTVALGLASALLTSAAGFLYAAFDRKAFWGMALLCIAALALTPGLDGGHGADAARSKP